MPSKTKEKINVFGKPNAALDSLSMIDYIYIAQTEGISKVMNVSDENLHHYGMSFDFTSVDALNSALNKMKYINAAKKDSTATLENFVFYTVDSKSATIKEPLPKKSEEGNTLKAASKMGKMLTFKWIIGFDGRKVKKVESEISASRKKSSIIINLNADQVSKRTKETIAEITFK